HSKRTATASCRPAQITHETAPIHLSRHALHARTVSMGDMRHSDHTRRASHILLRHRLLLQPHRSEGLLVVEVELHPRDPALAPRIDTGEARRRANATRDALAAPQGTRHHAVLAHREQLL